MFWAANGRAPSSRQGEIKELAYCLSLTLSAVTAISLLGAWDAKLAIEAYFALGF